MTGTAGCRSLTPALLVDQGARYPCNTGTVANLTLAIDEDLLRRARIRALEQGTSVNAVVREFLESYAGSADRARNMRRFLDLAAETRAGSRGWSRQWRREDLYDDRVSWPRS